MNLYFDIGNTRAKYCVADMKENTTLNRLSPISAIDNELICTDWLEQNFNHIGQIFIASVKHNAIQVEIESWANNQKLPVINISTEKERFGLINSYDDVSKMGVDRWLAMVGAVDQYPNKTLIVVDAGTATTLELVANNGRHVGGWILPGIQTMLDGLLGATEKVAAQATVPNKLRLGNNTNECVNQALWAATLGLIDRAKQLAAKQGLNVDHIIITGGNGERLSQLFEDNCEYIPTLIFNGLQCYSRVTSDLT